MNLLHLIEAKRHGHAHSTAELKHVARSAADGSAPDYQLAAWLMAAFLRGLDTKETTALTLAMRDSGDVLSWPNDPRPVVDKHSTGGVGDKVSLPLAPLLACLGFRVPMISGRGLGITGGTLDKLDSIPGFQTRLSAKRIVSIVQKVGCVICGQTERMVPADRVLYALRDVTGTVPSIPLIVSSILSKKLAENLDALVLDVKFGSAAFMPDVRNARRLARALTTLGRSCGVDTRAVLTRMDQPLGRAAGNWLEVKESLSCLNPGGDCPTDLRELVLRFAAHLLEQTRKVRNFAAGWRMAEACLSSGAPRRKWDEMLRAQGADLAAFERKLARDQTAEKIVELRAAQGGYVALCDAGVIGKVVRDLGGGRHQKESAIHHEAGVDCLAKLGDAVRKGAVLARIHGVDDRQAHAARDRMREAFAISRRPIKPPKLIAGAV